MLALNTVYQIYKGIIRSWCIWQKRAEKRVIICSSNLSVTDELCILRWFPPDPFCTCVLLWFLSDCVPAFSLWNLRLSTIFHQFVFRSAVLQTVRFVYDYDAVSSKRRRPGSSICRYSDNHTSLTFCFVFFELYYPPPFPLSQFLFYITKQGHMLAVSLCLKMCLPAAFDRPSNFRRYQSPYSSGQLIKCNS